MPQTVMDWIVTIGVIAGLVAAYYAYRQFTGGGSKTINKITQGNRNTQEGGPGQTENSIKDGNDNSQKG